MGSSKFKMQSSKLKFKGQSSGKKIAKILLLLGIREGYLLTRNLFGIVEHPRLTFGRIVRQKDFSQGILIFGLPVGFWLGWIFVLLVSRIFVFGRLKFGFLAKASFLASTLLTACCLLLIAYSFLEVWKRGRREKWEK